ncbi:unnamed protein product [Pedinophyceae sp. YPF-701]|nr:unnamed protein product [Pedinophyceae sp. YPF-701]
MDSPSVFRKDALAGRVALLSGGSSGIGYEITRQLGMHGCTCAVMGRRQTALDGCQEELAQEGIKVITVQGDVRKYDDCARAVAVTAQELGRIDILVNCAAGNFLAPAETLSSNGFRTVLEIDTLGTFNLSRAAFSELKRARGCIVNISMTLHYGATWFQTHACAAKAGVDAMTRGLALEWGRHGIRVNGIAPGPIEGTAGMAKLQPKEPKAGALNSIPVGRMGKKQDIGLAAVFLCSSAAAFVSGDTLVVDGANWLWKEPLVDPDSVSELSRKVEGGSRAVGVAAGPRSRM